MKSKEVDYLDVNLWLNETYLSKCNSHIHNDKILDISVPLYFSKFTSRNTGEDKKPAHRFSRDL